MTWTVGLTGGIGSGKSAVADLFTALGVVVVDSDALAHELTAPDGAAMPRIAREFGQTYLQDDGALDRKAMRELAFSDPTAKQRLEGILHPMIRDLADQRIAAATGPGASCPYAIRMVPLLIETGIDPRKVQRVLVVDCPEAAQRERVARRSHLDPAQIQRIMDSQASRSQRLARADDVIDNSGSPAQLPAQVERLHRQYLQLARA
jgi:dephospho-CoA kinase